MIETYIQSLIADRIEVLKTNKERLELQITQATGKEQELPEAFEDQRREKLAETIKELNILQDENYIISTTYVTDVE